LQPHFSNQKLSDLSFETDLYQEFSKIKNLNLDINQIPREMTFTKQQFQQRLEEFFERHDPAKVDLSHRIANRYHLHQEQVFFHLTRHYDKGNHPPENFLQFIDQFVHPDRY
jgi:hypothetical protein